MLAANRILAGSIDGGLFAEIGFASKSKSPVACAKCTLVSINVNDDGLGPSLLAGPALNVPTAGIRGDAITKPKEPERE